MKSIYRKYITTVTVIWAGCFIPLLFAYMLVLRPQKKSKEHVEKQLAEKRQMYESAIEAAQEETKIWLKEEMGRLQNGLRDFVIDFGDSGNLTFDISRIAGDKQVGSFSIRNKNERGCLGIPNCTYIGENQIDISFTGGFNQFATFINALERHRPVIFVDKFKITREESERLGHQVNMNLAIFVKKPQGS